MSPLRAHHVMLTSANEVKRGDIIIMQLVIAAVLA